MNEWLRKITEAVSNFWKNSSVIKKVILFGVLAVIIFAIVLTTRVSSKPTGVRLFNSQVTDEQSRNQILDRISQENISAHITDDGYIIVPDEKTAVRLRDTLVSENLVPSYIDPFAGFYNRSWNTTDAEQRVKLKNAITRTVKNHLEAIADIVSADVAIVSPEPTTFFEDQKPVSASIVLKLTPNSDLATNRRRIQGVQKIILSAVEGLKEENLVISDMEGNVLNDFDGMADFDRLSLIEKQQKLKRKTEAEKKAEVLSALQKLASADRIRDLNINVDFDMSEKSVESTEYSPIVIKKDNPDTPYDDSEYRDTLPISQQTVTKEWQGTG